MKKPVWEKAIPAAADPVCARKLFERLSATSAGAALGKASAEQVRLLAALFSGSPALGNRLIANPDWFAALDIERLRFPRRAQGLRQDMADCLLAAETSGALARLRQFHQREMLRIAARDLARLGGVAEIIREISDVADVCLEVVWQICRQQLIERLGRPFHQDSDGDWQPTESCIIGLGKLGGQELNYSSDVDLMFVYAEEGHVFKERPVRGKTSRTALTSHHFFNRLAEAFIAEVSRLDEAGALYRIDVRLRPEGETGPLCRSLGSYENYYGQWGQTWERLMLIKARGVAGHAGLAAEFLETIQPFRYPRALSRDYLQEIGAMKDRIENEVVRAGELDRNVKLGRGGIREIEFITQALQLLHAGRQPFLQGAQTLPALEKLAQYRLLPAGEARALRDAYGFLRDVEHRLQMEENLQTHTIPDHRPDLERLARLMGLATARKFEAARRKHTAKVRASFERVLKSSQPPAVAPAFPRAFAGQEAVWKNILAVHSFRDPDRAFPVLREFVEGPGYGHVSSRTVECAHQLLVKLLALCPCPGQAPILSDPDRVLTRLDSFITAYGARSSLFEVWNANPTIFELLLKLFDRSEFLAELAIRTPDLVDDLVLSGRLRRSKAADETLRDLRLGLQDADQFLWLRRYHQAELMRIGLRDILGLADFEQHLTELSALAEACLKYALEVVMHKHRLKTPPFAVIGLGKLGGAEIDYGSDLDLIFVSDDRVKDLPRLQRLALEVMELVSRRTEMGIVFQTDARLRPDGEKGRLVNTLTAYEQYYRQRAQLWEIQTLTRTRPVAGDRKLGGQFQQLAAALTDFKSQKRKAESGKRETSEPPHVGCYEAAWKDQIHLMRLRIEAKRTPAGQEELAIKTGEGGLMDAEFIAQTLCLENGWQIPNTLAALERGRTDGGLPGAVRLINSYRELRRVEGILRRWSYEGETVLPDDPAPFYRVAVRCGFATPERFREKLAQWRAAIREVYLRFFHADGSLRKERSLPPR